MNQSLTNDQMDKVIRPAMEEDLGTGDITTRSVVLEGRILEAEIVARESMVLCGTEIFKRVFQTLDDETVFPELQPKDGTRISEGQIFLKVKARSIVLLEGERTALNFLQRLCGIATLTRKFVEKAGPVTVLDTRKTTPGLRALEKYAVSCGGGTNHRFGLFDGILIKDNLIRVAGGITQAIERVRKNHPGSHDIEVETGNLDQVQEALMAGADVIMLDNMNLVEINEAVKLIAKRAKIEVSGSINLERAGELSGCGIDTISVGALTHSAPAADISMNIPF